MLKYNKPMECTAVIVILCNWSFSCFVIFVFNVFICILIISKNVLEYWTIWTETMTNFSTICTYLRHFIRSYLYKKSANSFKEDQENCRLIAN